MSIITYENTKLENLNLVRNKLDRIEFEYENETYVPTKRFWSSLARRFHFSDKFFLLFEPEEVFARVIQNFKDKQRIRLTIESNNGKGRPKLLAISNPDNHVLEYEEVLHLMNKQDGGNISYDNGIVTSTFTPAGGDNIFKIGGDNFEQRFELKTPIDGKGSAKIVLSLLRQVCSNGMTALSPVFSSPVKLGTENQVYNLNRAIESFSNDDGFSLLERKMSLAQNSVASVSECQQVFKTLMKTESGSKRISEFHKMTGNISAMYGLSNINTISHKKQKILPTKCSVYDLLNFLTELSTHYAKSGERTILQGMTGTLLANDYDLENTMEESKDFQDLFLV